MQATNLKRLSCKRPVAAIRTAITRSECLSATYHSFSLSSGTSKTQIPGCGRDRRFNTVFAIYFSSIRNATTQISRSSSNAVASMMNEDERYKKSLIEESENYQQFINLVQEQAMEINSSPVVSDGNMEQILKSSKMQDIQSEGPNIADLLKNFDANNAPSKDDLHALQLWYECESYRDTLLEKEAEIQSARERNDYASLGNVKRHLLEWYTPLKEAIEAEQLSYLKRDGKREGRNNYGPFLLTLKADKMAVILAHEGIGAILREGGGYYGFDSSFSNKRGGGMKLIRLAARVADAIEAEVSLERVLAKIAKDRLEKKKVVSNSNSVTPEKVMEEKADMPIPDASKAIKKIGNPYSESALDSFLPDLSKKSKSRRLQHIIAKARNILDNDYEWPNNLKIQLGCALIQILVEHSKLITNDEFRGQPALKHEVVVRKGKGLQGFVSVHRRLFEMAVEENPGSINPFTTRYQPMIVPPDNYESPKKGGYKALEVGVMRLAGSEEQRRAIALGELSEVYRGLDCLGKVPWVINEEILDVAIKLRDEGIALGDIPSAVDFDVPPIPADRPEKPPDYVSKDDPGYIQYKEDMQNYIVAVRKHRKAVQKNMDLRSLRCSAALKLNQAQKFKDFKEIYFPFNLDFRGRAYPIPPHLNHLGSDLSRGLLTFAHPKPLGKNGLYWLKVHLANLCGANKMSFHDRVKYSEENLENIRNSARDPFADDMWWMSCEEPFQALATCKEIINAIDSEHPSTYLCSLPVHMDGSCNGLQHYAALGRDTVGGRAVNLMSEKVPQDVYVGVMEEVIRRVEEEASQDVPLFTSLSLTKDQRDLRNRNKAAKLVVGSIDRGVVKRTVMTSVYGVTFRGARDQILEKIIEKLEEKGLNTDELEEDIFNASNYLASVTMDVMGDLFKGARQTQNWLTECARLIASTGHPVAWVTPLGIPVIQPYRHKKLHSIRTVLQRISLAHTDDDLPIHKSRQVSAFPPNYVHSLDATHMLMSALEMNKKGLTFTAVHDSFWTHPCDIDKMNDVLRSSFVELYEKPLLQDLLKTWEVRFPDIDFPPLPDTGSMDISCVRDSPYFFQ